jgi:3-phenylpropionate/cinnamic acid dioxygenase small subunit
LVQQAAGFDDPDLAGCQGVMDFKVISAGTVDDRQWFAWFEAAAEVAKGK